MLPNSIQEKPQDSALGSQSSVLGFFAGVQRGLGEEGPSGFCFSHSKCRGGPFSWNTGLGATCSSHGVRGEVTSVINWKVALISLILRPFLTFNISEIKVP